MSNKINKKAEFTSFGTRISDKVGRYSYSPSFQKKADQAQKMIEKAGFPEFTEKRDNKAKSD
jgi:hypothetical protein